MRAGVAAYQLRSLHPAKPTFTRKCAAFTQSRPAGCAQRDIWPCLKLTPRQAFASAKTGWVSETWHALVLNLVNGFVVESNCPEAIGRAMLHLASNGGTWETMVAALHARAWMGDTARLADAVELLLYPGAEPPTGRVNLFFAEMELEA